MKIDQCSSFLTDEQKHYIDHILLKSICFVCQQGLVKESDEAIGFSHCVLARKEDCNSDAPVIIDIDNFEFMVSIFEAYLRSIGFVGDYDLKRIAINATTSALNSKESAVHVDHDYNHSQLLIQLNDNFIGGGTAIYPNHPSKEGRIVVKPKKYNGYSFEGCWHSAVLPEKGVRIMAVYTYDTRGENEVGS